MSRPATPPAVGDVTPADHIRACNRLSMVHGRQIRSGWAVDELAREYAACYRAGYEQAVRDLGVPAPRVPVETEERP